MVKLLMILLFPLGWPISKLLDAILGHEERMYRRAELRELVRVHGQVGGGDLTVDEITIITGALDMIEKTVFDIMTPLREVFMLRDDTILDERTLQKILKTGHSRIPIYKDDNTDPDNILGVLLVKSLIMLDPEDATPIKDTDLFPIPIHTCDTSLYDVLNEFQTGKSHILMATDLAERKNLGIVTLEDVIEELIQEEIADETDFGGDPGRTVELADLIRRMSVDLTRRTVTGRTVATRKSVDIPRARLKSMDLSRHDLARISTESLRGSPSASRVRFSMDINRPSTGTSGTSLDIPRKNVSV